MQRSSRGQVDPFIVMDRVEDARRLQAPGRALMLDRLPRTGFSRIAPPDRAFHVHADVSDLTADSRAFAHEILHEAGVAVSPGLDFDPARGARRLRFSDAGATADIAEGLQRLERFMVGRR